MSGKMETFGKFDWLAYYKVPRVAKVVPVKVDPFVDWPCENCDKLFLTNGCQRALSPDARHFCPRYCAWVKKWWPIVTGQKLVEK